MIDGLQRRFATPVQRGSIRVCCFVLLFCAAVGPATTACAQDQYRSPIDRLLFESAFPNNIDLEQNYRAGVEAIQRERWADAVDYLQAVIDSPIDAYPDRTDSPTWSANQPIPATNARSWKTLAVELFGQLPDDGLKVYAERFETATSAALRSLRDNPSKRLRLALAHRWTKSGWNVVLETAAKELDTGRPANALALLDELPDGIVPGKDAERDNRKAVAERLLSDGSSQSLAVGQGSVRTNAANAPLTGHPAWHVPLVEDSEVGDVVESWDAAVTGALADLAAVQTTLKSRRAAIEPLIVGSTAIFAGMGRARAYDVETGALLWRSALADSTLRYLTKRAIGVPGQTQENRRLWLAGRLAADRTQGRMSSNGKLAFAVIDAGADIIEDKISASSWEHPLSRAQENRLVALEVSTGRIMWWIGGANSGASPPPLAGAYFLGPPSFRDEFGYVLVEVGGVIQLVELDLESGTPRTTVDIWNDTISPLNSEQIEATSGASPLFAGPLAICQLERAIVAFNVDTRTIAWTIPASPKTSMSQQLQSGLNEGRELHAQISIQNGFKTYPRVVAVEDSVVVVGMRSLQSVDLFTGDVNWLEQRSDVAWVESASASQLALVTARGLEGVNVLTGEKVWEVALPPLSGSGVLFESRLTVPLQTGELVTVDTRTGHVISRTPTRDDRPQGTLITNGTHTLTFDGHSLRAMRAIAPAEVTPTIVDSEGAKRDLWVDRAAALLHQDEVDRAINILELLVENESSADDRSSNHVEALLAAALSSDPDIRPDRFAKLVNKIDRSKLPLSAAVPMQRLLIQQASESGDRLTEAQRHVELIGFGRTDDFIDIDRNRRINTHQQSVARLSELASILSETGRASLAEWVSEFIQSASTDTRAKLARNIPASVCDLQASLQLADSAEPAVLRELLYWEIVDDPRVAESTDAKGNEQSDTRVETGIRTRALLALGDLYAKYGRTHDLDEIVAALEGSAIDSRSADAADQDAGTDAEAADEVQSDRESSVGDDVIAFLERRDVGRLLSRVPDWQPGPLSVERRPAATYGDGTRPLKVFRLGRTSRSLPIWRATPQAREFRLIAPTGQTVESFPAAPSIMYGFSRVFHVDLLGHLAVVSSIDRGEVFDTLSHPVRRLGVLKHTTGDDPRASLRVSSQRSGLKTPQTLDANGQSFGSIGPPSISLMTYVREDRLFAVDPFDIGGPTLWEVGGITPGSEIFGDDQFILVRKPGDIALRGFNAQDGVEVEVADVPKSTWFGSGSSIVGRSLLTFEEADEEKQLSLFDPVTGENVWEIVLPGDAVLRRDLQSTQDQNHLVVGDSGSGSVSIYRLTDGEQVASASFPPMEVAEFAAHRAGDKMFVFTGAPPTENIPKVGPSERRALALQSGRDAALVNGPVIAFDLTTGERLWTREIDDQRFTAGQPASLPMLVFASNYVMPLGDGSTRVKRGMHVEMIDKTTGETLWDESELPFELKQTWKPTPDRSPGTDIDFQSFVLKVRPKSLVENDADAPPQQPAEPETNEPTGDDLPLVPKADPEQ